MHLAIYPGEYEAKHDSLRLQFITEGYRYEAYGKSVNYHPYFLK
jgi:hypothetical protein